MTCHMIDTAKTSYTELAALFCYKLDTKSMSIDTTTSLAISNGNSLWTLQHHLPLQNV